MDKPVASVVFDPDVLFATDTYIAEQTHKGHRTTRSQIVNAALLEFLARRREEQTEEAS